MPPRPPSLLSGRRTASRALIRAVASALLVTGSGVGVAATGSSAADAALADLVARRLHGDRTGACFAVATLDGDAVARAYVCADGGDASRRIGPDTAFEIGSVSKTMLAALLAESIREGKASLDDPLSAYLPEGAQVPEFEGQPIRLRHIVTHTSGLPAIPAGIDYDPENPYAQLDARMLLDALAKTPLTHAPGTQFEYSNFATMLLSYAVARRNGVDFETLLRTRVFAPLGMRHSYVDHRPEGVRAAQGHLPNAKPTPAWTFGKDLAGVGGVRATLDDMVRYVQAQIGAAPEPLGASLRMTQQPVPTAAEAPMAMHWMRANLRGRTWISHEGGTGGFAAFVAFDPETRRGAIVLSDTAQHSLGGLGGLGLHLLDPEVPLAKPRRVAKPPRALVDSLVGEYQMQGMRVSLRRKGDTLEGQAQGQEAFRMGYDDAGDFFPLDIDALLTPRTLADGRMGFVWHQGGGQMLATPVAKGASAPAFAAPPADVLAGYVGAYPLMPGFVLTLKLQGETLMAQATGQGAFPLTATAADTFAFDPAGIVIRFVRGDDGRVRALNLEQGGNTLRGERQ